MTIISNLIKILGNDSVLYDEQSKYIYGKDLTQNYTPNPQAIVFPKKADDVCKIVQLANATMTKLVPSGGRTGYSGGAVAKDQEIVVSFEKMHRIIKFNKEDKIIICEPGVTIKTIQDFALKNNLFYPIDFASTSTCQIGGNIATNAGGIKVIRYGLTREWVCGLKVVTGNGDLLELNYGLIKNATGYDLRHLFIGSEGTLGLITEASLRLTDLPLETKVILCAVSNRNHFIDILNIFSASLQATAFEFFSELALLRMREESKLKHPFSTSTPFYILLEYETNKEADRLAKEIIKKCVATKIITKALISKNSQQAAHFWRFRKEISMSLAKYSPYKYDIAVLPSNIPSFIKKVESLFNKIYPALEIVWFGHIGDGNLHLNILKPAKLSNKRFFSYCNSMSEALYSLIQEYRGAVSAEHGVGLLKKDFLCYSKNEVEINYMRSLKQVFDRNNIMNPGKIF
jgi:glycolate oxidase subunit GlcD